jgi:DNA-directed RNA polymerase specialized sigma24 family protein
VRELDSVLVRRSQAGDVQAWQELVRRHAAAVRATIRSATLDAEDADAKAEEVFLRAHRLLFTLRDVTWFPLYAVRHAKAMVEERKAPGAQEPLLQALGQVPAATREVLFMHHALARPGELLLMEYLGLSREAVLSRLERGHRALAATSGMTEDAVREHLARICAADAARDLELARRVAAKVEARRTGGFLGGLVRRLPPLPLPLALALAVAVAGMLIGLILRMIPPPPEALAASREAPLATRSHR